MNPQQAKKMHLTTDFPLDKVVGLYSGSFSVPNNSMAHIVTIPHGLPFRPLPGGNWSNISDFSIQYEYGTGTFPAPPGRLFSQISNVFADSDNIYISTDNVSGSTKTVYYRIFVFEPPDSAADLSPIADISDVYMINSDYNNAKLFINSYVDVPANPGGSINVDVEHSIGTIPQSMGWVVYPSWNGVAAVQAVHPIGSTSSWVKGILMSANEQFANFTVPQDAGGRRVYYRLYLDE